VRAFGDPDEEARRRKRVDAAELAEVEAAGIDLDPPTPGDRLRPRVHDHEPGHEAAGHEAAGHEHGRDHHHGNDHEHAHEHSSPGEPPLIGIVGAGAVGTALGVALTRAGWPIAAVASRDPARRDRFRQWIPGTRAFAEANALLDEVELVILAVPDDVIGEVAADLHLYSGQAIVHTSGLLGANVLMPAMAAGTQIGAFHPLVAFADIERAVAALKGATIAIEGDDQLADLLARMAEVLGGVPVRLVHGAKAAYHAAAVLAAGGVVALLDAIAELGRVAGLDEAGSLAVYAPLIRQTLDNAAAIGIRAALTGPMTRGDVGTLRAHLDELARDAPGVLDVYLALARREVDLAESRGVLAPEVVGTLRASLANRP
jgi:predicted short-subunit dehydrogenase-like oxidoreductase (DUF2520 family)